MRKEKATVRDTETRSAGRGTKINTSGGSPPTTEGTMRDEPATRKQRKRLKAETSNTVRTPKREEEEHKGNGQN